MDKFCSLKSVMKDLEEVNVWQTKKRGKEKITTRYASGSQKILSKYRRQVVGYLIYSI